MIKRDDKKQLKKYFFWAIVAALIMLSYIVIQDLMVPLVSAFILSYLSLPLYKKMSKKIGDKSAAITCILIFLLIIIIPLGAIVAGITNQAAASLSSENIDQIINTISSNKLAQSLNINIDSLMERVVTLAISLITSSASYLPSLIITIIIISLGMFYALTEWENFSKQLKSYLPFENKKEIINEIQNSTSGLVYGSILISFIEFIVAAIGLYLIGIDYYLLLPVLIFFLAFIPGLGPTIIWLPMLIYYGFMGDYITSMGIATLGIILSIGIDTVLRSKILGEKANIHPFIMIVGVLGGISVFGIFGFILGPLILVYTIRLTQEVLSAN